MATLQDTAVSGTSAIQLPKGTTGERPASPQPGMVRYNTSEQSLEFYNGTQWIIGNDTIGTVGTQENPAPSGIYLVKVRPGISNGYYWIQSPRMPDPIEMYVDTNYDGGGYDFFDFNTGTIDTPQDNHAGRSLGLDVIYPRSSNHWRALSDFVRNVLGDTGNSRLNYMGAVNRETTDSGGGSVGDYTSFIMRNPLYYQTGAPDWRVPDGRRWWLRDSTFSEPNGDYTRGNFLGNYTFEDPYTGQDLKFNDGDSTYSAGPNVVLSTNTKA